MLSVGIVLVLVVAGLALLPRPRSAGADRAAEPPAAATQIPTGAVPSAQDPGPISLVGFGDSVMAGAGCDCDDFLVQTGTLLHDRTGREVTTSNHAANGATTADLLEELRTDDASAAAIAGADVIVLTVGANDLLPAVSTWDDDGCGAGCYDPAVHAMSDRLGSLLTIIDREKKPEAAVLVTSYWNVFEDGAVGRDAHGSGFLSWSDEVTRAADDAICAAADRSAATCIDLYRPFKGDGDRDPTGLLADDGDHPNARGTQLIAAAVADAAGPLLPR